MRAERPAKRGIAWPPTRVLILLVLACLAVAGCRRDMQDQPNYTALEPSDFFADGRASRAPVEGTVARGQLFDDPHLMTGKVNGRFVRTYPFEITPTVMQRGRDRYNIFCSPCHDAAGSGRGMVVRRGFPEPTSLHDQRLRDSEEGYLFDVINKGYGRMLGYAAQVPVEDRWAIVAYIRALQYSRNVPESDLPAEIRRRLPPKGEAP